MAPLGNMRANGVRSVDVSCWRWHHRMSVPWHWNVAGFAATARCQPVPQCPDDRPPREPLRLPPNCRDVMAEKMGTAMEIVGATAAKAPPSRPGSCLSGHAVTAIASIAGMMLHCGEWTDGPQH